MKLLLLLNDFRYNRCSLGGFRMNKIIIEKARNKYIELVKAKAELEEVKKILLMEKQTDKIKKCLGVIEREESKIPSEDEILRYSFYNVEEEELTCNIYVFIGYYGAASPNHLAPLSEKNPHVRYKYCVNLETTDIVVVEINKTSEFEKDNIVLYLDDPKNYHHIGFYREKLNELRNKYFEYLVNNSQKEAIKQIIKKR